MACVKPRHHLRRRRESSANRRGAIVVLAAVLMVAMLGVIAFAVDVGYLLLARTELQRTADAAALAGARSFADDARASEMISRARQSAVQFVTLNKSGPVPLAIDANVQNIPTGDIVVGTISDFSNRDAPMSYGDPSSYNGVRVRVRRAEGQNGEVPLFFARVFGRTSSSVQAEATAAVIKRVRGFRRPPRNDNLPILPIALSLDSWNNIFSGLTTRDDWAWNSSDKVVEPGTDDLNEVRLYPESNDGPGNFGTVNIGIDANSTSHLSRQILHGLSQADVDYHGGTLALDETGRLLLAGDTGISVGIKDELLAIRGETRVVPVYQEVNRQGNNTMYTIVKFAGVRIMDVRLTGPEAEVVVQPADVVTPNVVPAENETQSDFVYSPSHLVK